MLSNGEIQRNLRFLNYYWGEIDGIIGPISTRAIREFQGENGLYVDGMWGNESDGQCVKVITEIQAALGVAQDGIVGNITESALKDYQRANGLSADGICGALTLGVMRGQEAPSACDYSQIKYFTREENKCHCGGNYCDGYPAEMRHSLMKIADAVRESIARPLICTSGVRCARHNANVGGVSGSKHLSGSALDCYASGISGSELLDVFYSKGIAWGYVIADDVIHVEV